ncbi:hypothetical protein B0H19DRAFT_1175434 [Mycena capillaripes]|nr:hypothetical protein B0H19DRAFT_1175434 [Mycena capillaripes]
MDRLRQKRPRKPPACDTCKARRVLCHPQPNGAPCPRCAEKNIVCTTTPVMRGRPRGSAEPDSSLVWAPESVQQLWPKERAVSCQLVRASPSSSITLLSPELYSTLPECPDLTPELVAHLFDCFDQIHFVFNPIIIMSSIKTTIRAVSFKVDLLPPQSRVLAMCILAVSSIISFHEVILGPGPRPASFSDIDFFSSQTDVRGCGARRAPACRALYAAALKAACETGVMLQVSTENAASCFLIDLLEQTDFTGPSRPWASASMSHIRALAPSWQSTIAPPYSTHWCGFLMAEALLSARNRKPLLITHEDQLLLCGHEVPTAEELLASLEASSKRPGAELLSRAMRPYMFHITRLALQLWTTITGDHLRLMPLSEFAVLQFLSALSLTHAILSHMLACADAVLAASGPAPQIAFVLGYRSDISSIARGCAFRIITGFAGLVLPLYQVLQLRVEEGGITSHARERMRLLLTQAGEMVRLAVRELARAMRYVPVVRYLPVQHTSMHHYAQFALDEAEAASVVEPDRVRDLATIAGHLRMAGYWTDFSSSPELTLLIERLDRYVENATRPVDLFDPDTMLADFIPRSDGSPASGASHDLMPSRFLANSFYTQ